MNRLKLLENIMGVTAIAIMPLLSVKVNCMLPIIVTAVISVVYFIYSIIQNTKIELKINITDIVFIAFIMYGVIRMLAMQSVMQWDFYLRWSGLICLYFISRLLIVRNLLFYGLIFGGFIQGIIGILQITEIIEPVLLFEITGSFSNPAPYAGYLSVSCICAVSIAVTELRKEYITIVSRVISYALLGFAGFVAIMIIIADSRAAIMAVSAGLAWLFLYNVKSIRKRWYIIPITAAMLFLTSALYLYRTESADSRLLIWRVSANMLLDAPFLGHGPGTFEKIYMLYQMNFLQNSTDSSYSQVAGYTKFTYNEFIHIAVEGGIIGLCLLILLLLTAFAGRNTADSSTIPLRCSIIAWCVFGSFSYPVKIWTLAAIIIMLLASGNMNKVATFKVNHTLWMGIAVICSLWIFQTACWNRQIKRINGTMAMNDKKSIEPCFLYSFVKQNYTQLKANQYLYDKSILILCELEYDINNIEDMLNYVSPSCLNYCTIGKMYCRNKQYDKAEKYFTDAHYMVPTMITPVYELFKMCLSKGDHIKTYFYARKILEMPIKVENTKTLKAKNDARIFVSQHS